MRSTCAASFSSAAARLVDRDRTMQADAFPFAVAGRLVGVLITERDFAARQSPRDKTFDRSIGDARSDAQAPDLELADFHGCHITRPPSYAFPTN
jgi:hypothetical protein